MKRFFYLLSIAGFMALTACDPEQGNDNGGSDLPEGVSVQAEATAGTKVTVKGTGFSEDAKFYLKDASGNDIELKAEVLSAGAEVTLPYNLGDFTMYVDQSGETVEVGKITVKVTGVKLPGTVAPGVEFEVTGDGFAEDAVLVLTGADKKSNELETTYSTGKLTARTDADFAAGTYSLSVKQAGTSQVLSEEFVVKTTKKRLVGLTSDYAAYEITYGSNGSIAVDGIEMEINGNVYTMPQYSVSMTIENGRVISANIEGEDCPWEYNGDYLSMMNGTVYYDEQVSYENGNFVNEVLQYNDANLKNISSVDYGLLVKAMMLDFDELVSVAAMLGWTGKPSANLPSNFDLMGDGTYSVINYDYDDDGYVKTMSVEDLGLVIEFVYE